MKKRVRITSVPQMKDGGKAGKREPIVPRMRASDASEIRKSVVPINPPIYGTKQQAQLYQDSLNLSNSSIRPWTEHGTKTIPTGTLTGISSLDIVDHSRGYRGHAQYTPDNKVIFDKFEKESGMRPIAYVTPYDSETHHPIYATPKQPVFYKEPIIAKPSRVKQQYPQLPISQPNQLPTGTGYTPRAIDNPYITESTDWYSPEVQGDRYVPAGFRTTSKMKKFQNGGNVRGTKLQSAEEKKYQQWRNTLPTNLQYEGNYDLRGFYKDNPTWSPNTPGQHMTDRYKLPNHPTFSNESMYYSPANKDSAGYWQGNMYIPYNPAVKDTVREFKDGGITYTGTRYDNGGGVKKGDKRVLPKQQQEVRTTNYIPPMEQFRTSSNAVVSGAPWENKPMYINPYAGQQEIARTAEPQRSAISKAGQVARHPMTAASYMMKGQPVPDYLGYGEKNVYDNAVDILNPLTYYDAGKRVVTAEHFRNPNTSVGEAIGLTALDAAMIYGIGKGVYNKYSPKSYQRVSASGIRDGEHVGSFNDKGNFVRYTQEPKNVVNSPEFEKRVQEMGAEARANAQAYEKAHTEWSSTAGRLPVEEQIIHGYNKPYPVLHDMLGYRLEEIAKTNRYVPGIAQSPHVQEQQQYQKQQSGVPFYLNNSTPQQVPQKQSKKATKQQPKIQHIGSGNFTVLEYAPVQDTIQTVIPVQQWQSNNQGIPMPQDTPHFNKRVKTPTKAQKKEQEAIEKMTPSARIEWYHSHNGEPIILDSMKPLQKKYKQGGKIDYTGTNRPADKVHYTPQQMKEGGRVRKDVPKKEIDGRSYYDPFTGSMYLDKNQYNDPAVYNHEAFHEYQDRTGGLSVPEYWEGPLKRPYIVNTDDIKGAYFNRKNIDENILTDMFLDRNPEFQFVPQDIIRNRFVEDIQYNVPWTEEGEAQQYEKTGKFPDEMRKGGKVPIAKNGIKYTKTANKPATITTTQSPGYVPQYSVGEQYMMEHPQQYMRSAEGYGTPQQQRDHEYLRSKMYQQEADERANREFAQKMKPGSELADKILTADMMLSGAGIVNKGLRGISKKVAKKLADDVMPYSGNFPAAYTKGVRGNTPMPTITEVPQMTKEQQILQSYGVNPRKLSNELEDYQKWEELHNKQMDRVVNREITPKQFDKWFNTNKPPTYPSEYKERDDNAKRFFNKLKDGVKKDPNLLKNMQQSYDRKQIPMFSTKGPSKKGEIFEQGYIDPFFRTQTQPIIRDDSYLIPEGKEYDKFFGQNYKNFGPVTPYQRQYEGKGMPKSLIPNELQQNQYGGAIMKKKIKITGVPQMATGGDTDIFTQYYNSVDERPVVQGTQHYRRKMVADPITGVGRIQQVPVDEQEWNQYASGAPTDNAPSYSYQQPQMPAVNPIATAYMPPTQALQQPWATGNKSNMYLQGDSEGYGLDAIRGNMDYNSCNGPGCYEYAYGGYAGQTPADSQGRRTLSTPWMGSLYATKGLPDNYEVKNTIPEAEEGEADIVIEKDEVVLQPTPSGLYAQKADAGSHDSGNDKGVQVPDGSFVLSDTKDLKIKNKDLQKEFDMPFKKSGYTPAKLGGKYVADLNKFTTMVNNPQTDNITRDTAQKMVTNISKKLSMLADYQERMKQEMGIPQPGQGMKYGGVPKMQGGGDGKLRTDGTPMVAVYNPQTGQMDYVPDTGYSLPEHTVTAKRPIKDTRPMAQVFDEQGRMSFVPDTAGYEDTTSQYPFRFDQTAPSLDKTFNTPFIVQPANTQANMQNVVPQKGVTIGNMQADTPVVDKKGEKKKEEKDYRASGFTTPDRLAMANSMLNYANLRKYNAWEPPVTGVIPRAVYMDPGRALAANSEQAGMAYRGLGKRGNDLSNYLAIQGQAGKNAADILGQYSNANVGIANQANQQAAQIQNALLDAQRNRLKALHQGNTIAAQQYDNAEREARADLLNVYQNAWKNEQMMDDLNQTSRFYKRDFNKGKMHFDSDQAKAEFMKEVQGGKGISDGSTLDAYSKAWQQAYDKAPSTITDEKERQKWADEYVDYATGKSKKKMAFGGFIPAEGITPETVTMNSQMSMPVQPMGPMPSYTPPTAPSTKRNSDIATTTNNPGNMKYHPWQRKFGAQPSGIEGKDGGQFAQFPDIEMGLAAYQTQLFGTTDGVMKSKYYTPDTTVEKAMKVWSNNGYGGDIYPEIRNKKLKELTSAERNELSKRQIKRESPSMFKYLKQQGIYSKGGYVI